MKIYDFFSKFNLTFEKNLGNSFLGTLNAPLVPDFLTNNVCPQFVCLASNPFRTNNYYYKAFASRLSLGYQDSSNDQPL